jgi:hypothetical protein
VGKKGGIERVAGKRGSGSWDDQKWLIGKKHAHVEGDRLVPDSEDAHEVLEALGSEPEHMEGDRFKAKPRPNVPEEEKPTPAQRRAQQRNIKKAQVVRRLERLQDTAGEIPSVSPFPKGRTQKPSLQKGPRSARDLVGL